MTKMYQVELVRPSEGPNGGEEKQIAWIEERGAQVDASVELVHGTTSSFWTVRRVYDKSLEKSDLKELQKNNRNSLPSIRDN